MPTSTGKGGGKEGEEERDGWSEGWFDCGGGMEGVDDCGLVGGVRHNGVESADPPPLEHMPSSYQASPRPKTTPSGRRAFGGGVFF